jgi:aspartyl protease family protein
MVRILVTAVVAVFLGVVAVQYLDQMGRTPTKVMTAAPAPANSRSLVLKANEDGHFAVDTRIDGRRIAFMVDTGASQIVIRASDAARLGFHASERAYSIKIHTANGEGRAAVAELGMVEVGDIVVRDLRALVVPDTALNVNLLGMSFLSRVRWTHERGRLVLEQ